MNRKSMILTVVALASVAVAAVAVMLFLVDSKDEASSAERPVAEDLEEFQLRIDPLVWREITIRAWFNEGAPTPDGRRLIKFISDYWLSQRAHSTLPVLDAYPEGLSDEIEGALLSLGSDHLVLSLATVPWIVDGINQSESSFLGVLAEAWARTGPGWTFNQVMFDSMGAPWFIDGLSKNELTVLSAAGALAERNQERATQLVEGLENDTFIFEELERPASGLLTLIGTTSSNALADELEPALSLVTEWMPAVEEFVGPYKAAYILVEILEPSELICGTAQTDLGDVPGFVSLYHGCLDQTTVIHELAHVVMQSGPIWFSEGVADLAVYHLTGEFGNYLTREATGLIDPRAHRERGAVGADTSSEYMVQGSLGAQLMVEIYQLLGPDNTSTVLKEISSGKYPKEAPVLVRVFQEGTPNELVPELTLLFDERFDSEP